MKLNYTSLQHPVEPVELPTPTRTGRRRHRSRPCSCSRSTATWRRRPGPRRRRAPGLRVGYVQTRRRRASGRALARRRRAARARAVWPGTSPPEPAYGGEHEAISWSAALDAAARGLGWDAVVVGPGPGSSARRPARPRRDGGARHRPRRARAGAADAASPRGSRAATRARATAGSATTRPRCSSCCWRRCGSRCRRSSSRAGRRGGEAPDGSICRAASMSCIEVCGDRHDLAVEPVDLDGYAASGLPARTMGRAIAEDPLFFAAPLAAGAGARRRRRVRRPSDGADRLGDRLRGRGRSACGSTRFATPTARAGRARGRRPPGRGRDRRPRRQRFSTWFASRARRSGRTPARAAGRQARRRGRDARSSAPSASSPRRSARRRAEWRELKRFYT